MAEDQTVPGSENIYAVRHGYIHPHYRAFMVVLEYSGYLPCEKMKDCCAGRDQTKFLTLYQKTLIYQFLTNFCCSEDRKFLFCYRNILHFPLGLETEFRSKKIPRNRLETVSVIPRKKVLIPRHSEVRGRVDSEARNGMEIRRKNSFLRYSQNNVT
jgi:hypothetical protein